MGGSERLLRVGRGLRSRCTGKRDGPFGHVCVKLSHSPVHTVSGKQSTLREFLFCFLRFGSLSHTPRAFGKQDRAGSHSKGLFSRLTGCFLSSPGHLPSPRGTSFRAGVGNPHKVPLRVLSSRKIP